jgi:hypothetical protein
MKAFTLLLVLSAAMSAPLSALADQSVVAQTNNGKPSIKCEYQEAYAQNVIRARGASHADTLSAFNANTSSVAH